MRAICVWTQKYKTRQVLVDMRKVREGKNYLYFAAEKSLPYLYSFTKEEAEKSEVVYNGRILCYGIPVACLSCEGELPDELKVVKEEEKKKYDAFVRKH